MPTPTEVVLDFLNALEQPGGFAQAVRDFFTEATRYRNVGMSDTVGIDQALAFVDGFMATTRASFLTVDMLTICESGNTVLTERIDYLRDTAGNVVMTIPLMGAFDVEGDKITGWRDYLDTAGIAAAAAA